MTKQQKISFCITCKGRLSHLKETLPRNLENNADYPNTEFVVLDYDSPDNLQQWIKNHFQNEVASGKVFYARYTPAPIFKMAHAKNMAHRLATGNILCNLDADNVTGIGFASWLNHKFNQNPEILVRPHSHSFNGNILNRFKIPQGLTGRIAVTANNFGRLHGYDEERHNGYGKDDGNFTFRAKQLDLRRISVPKNRLGDAIQHTDEERTALMGIEEKARHRIGLQAKKTGLGRIISTRSFQRRIGLMPYPIIFPANPDGDFGNLEPGAHLYDINNQPITLPPIREMNVLGDSSRQCR